MAQDPRDIAVWALVDRDGHVTRRLEQLLERDRPSPQDEALARELALGTCRRRQSIQALLRAYMDQPDRRLPGTMNEILAVGVYQLVFLDRIPDHAAVNEAVAQAVRHRHKRQSGLVNGVLRTIARKVGEPTDGPPPLTREAVPVAPDRYRVADRPVFPDPQEDPAGYLAAAHSLPSALARRWIKQLGSLRVAAEVAAHASARAPLTLRVNALAAGGDAGEAVGSVLKSLREDGFEPALHENGISAVLPRSAHLRNIRAFDAGCVQPQDATATAVVDAAAPAPGVRVLDFCAAPGTKTTHLAEKMNRSGTIVAVDVSPDKLRRIEDNCRRMGHTNVTTMLAEQVGSLDPESFDLVLVDAPCTNTGVLARRSEARWRFAEPALKRSAADQVELLAMALRFVAPGGRLVYSTCSIEPEENDAVVQRFVRRAGGFTLVDEKLTLPAGATDPTRWHDGGYYAVLCKA
ncbi:MAG: methyltransferase domain-containing protein [Phycisphaerae bacterium]|nr:methyltransferase domain-containing protein [Phycisphaerae bacterium]